MQNEDEFCRAVLKTLDWREAVDAFIECATSLHQCFTSGHITACLRVYRHEFCGVHGQISEYCRDAYYNGRIKYDGHMAVRVARVCFGLGRTPAGTVVFVYGPNITDVLAFPFEIDIPQFHRRPVRMPVEHPIQPSSPDPLPPDPEEMTATVHADLRLCIPRNALDVLFQRCDYVQTGCDHVWIRYDAAASRVILSIRGSEEYGTRYDVESTRGRVLFPRPVGHFEHGAVHPIRLVGHELHIDLNTTLKYVAGKSRPR